MLSLNSLCQCLWKLGTQNLSTDFTSAVFYVRVNLTTVQVLVAMDFELCTHKKYHMKWFSKLYVNVKFELARSISVEIGYPKSKHRFHLICVLCVRVNLTTLQVLVATDFELCTHKSYYMKWFSKLYLNVQFELTRSMSVEIGYIVPR